MSSTPPKDVSKDIKAESTRSKPKSSPQPFSSLRNSGHFDVAIYDEVIDKETEKMLTNPNIDIDYKELRKKIRPHMDKIPAIAEMLGVKAFQEQPAIPKDSTMVTVVKFEATQAIYEKARDVVVEASKLSGGGYEKAGVEVKSSAADYPAFTYIFAEGKDPLKGRKTELPGLKIEKGTK